MARNLGSRADPSLADLLQRRNSRDCSVLLDHFGVLYREHGPESRASSCSAPGSRWSGSS